MAEPVIAITGPERGAFGPRSLVALAVRFYGGKPLQIRPSQDPRHFDYHGVVVTGGHDIDPVLYAAEPEVEPRHDKARDALETRVIENALERRLPILGICRGAQLLNVCRGGTLFQELRSRRNRTSNRWTVLPLKTLQVEPDTLLAALMGTGRFRINSLHNQAIDRSGNNLKVSGRDLDGIVQAIEDPDYGFLLGVQWHPEFLVFMRRQRNLFRALVNRARELASRDGA
ncbi:MAG TPA: gamma-glutamyl-gamma-aminobutyrate hydrolase family protein [Rhodocyclaceae bacterium]|nr:gamma-glutamyl-gamma-aminobutyrate hydrolase family protein [Rhodocyclaceae bacterium]HRQ48292.1 gamma-glutamyl-gamma-aminobutyrate hydrolase family protein [Rhodocyclaceae bacterium]